MKKTTKIAAAVLILSAAVSSNVFAQGNKRNKNNWNNNRANAEMMKNCPNRKAGNFRKGENPQMPDFLKFESVKGTLKIAGTEESPLIILEAEDKNVYAVKVMGDKSEVLSKKGAKVELTGLVDHDSNIICIRVNPQPKPAIQEIK